MKKTVGKFDALLDVPAAKRVLCYTCNDVARPELVELLGVIRQRQALRITARRVYEILGKTEKGFNDRIQYDAFCRHLAHHEPLWRKAAK